MGKKINLNCDMAEGFGVYTIGNDEALLNIINSANVACGFHAGDPKIMFDFLSLADRAGVSVGAHPSFYDLHGFGRRPISMSEAEVEYMVAYQIGALQALSSYTQLSVSHVKPHGALANLAFKDINIARAICRAVKVIDNQMIVVALHGSKLQSAAEGLGLKVAREGYADRLYDDDGFLMSRSVPGAVINQPEEALRQCLSMVESGEILSCSGKILKVEIDTICLHGDHPTSVAMATVIRQSLEAAGIKFARLDEMSL